jgi:hypothetical protein
MSYCESCDNELAYGPCHAEQFVPIYGRIGRHSGKCWGGSFPRKEDYPTASSDEENAVEHEQLSLSW